jgi:hypothetical protein
MGEYLPGKVGARTSMWSFGRSGLLRRVNSTGRRQPSLPQASPAEPNSPWLRRQYRGSRAYPDCLDLAPGEGEHDVPRAHALHVFVELVAATIAPLGRRPEIVADDLVSVGLLVVDPPESEPLRRNVPSRCRNRRGRGNLNVEPQAAQGLRDGCLAPGELSCGQRAAIAPKYPCATPMIAFES